MFSEDVRERAIEHGARAIFTAWNANEILRQVAPAEEGECEDFARAVLEAPGVQWAELVDALADVVAVADRETDVFKRARALLAQVGYDTTQTNTQEVSERAARALLAQVKGESYE